MARIEQIEITMMDLKPMVRRSDAIQSFDSQETPILRIRDADGEEGVGYAYTIGGGWRHVETPALVANALAAQAEGFARSKMKIGWPHLS